MRPTGTLATNVVKNCLWGLRYFAQSFEGKSFLNQGILAVNFDVETANDLVHSHNLQDAKAMAAKSRIVLKELITLLDDLQVPVTLFCTGHTMMKECEKHSIGVKKWAVPKNGFNDFWANHDWYELDPGTNHTQDPEWYFGDLIEEFTRSSVSHEIASHTFSHPRCDLISRDEFSEDMNLLEELFDSGHLSMDSHAFPYDSPGHLKVLQEKGIKVCRMTKGAYPTSIESIAKSEGLKLAYVSLPGFVHPDLIKLGIDIAARNRKIFVWSLHPWDLSTDCRDFKRIIDYAAKKRVEDELAITTIGELAELWAVTVSK